MNIIGGKVDTKVIHAVERGEKPYVLMRVDHRFDPEAAQLTGIGELRQGLGDFWSAQILNNTGLESLNSCQSVIRVALS